MQMMSKNGFSRCGESTSGRLRKEGRYSTAHVYKNALLSFSLFCGTFKCVVQARSNPGTFTTLRIVSL